MAFWNRLRPLLQDLSRLRVSSHAAGAAFFLQLSLIPLALLALTLLQYVPVSRGDLFSLLEELVPQALLPLLRGLTDTLIPAPSRLVLSLSALVTLWSASKGLLGLLYGLNAVEGMPDARSYLHKRLLCMACTLGTLAALVLTLLLQVLAAPVLSFLARRGSALSRVLQTLMGPLRLYATALLAMFFSGLYLVLPAGRRPFSRVWPGALAAAGAWTLFSGLFSYYVNHVSNYPVLYGGLGTLLLAMLWLYFCISILFYGVWFNKLLFCKKDG